ncbi:MAG TPA: RDD family protein [Pyrinomonadaceae bacterium]|nr:RDD family protein [Pyrinomonadaceae bacterium]
MINDTVREELATKISRNPEPALSNSGGLMPKAQRTENAPRLEQQPRPDHAQRLQPTARTEPPVKVEPPVKFEAPPQMPVPAKPAAPSAKPIAARFETNDLHAKKTSPTLVEFQTKKATVPEWRLQLQNSVRQKVGTNRREGGTPDGNQVPQNTPRSTNGSNALKVEYVEDEQPSSHQNPRVANALKRIEESRRAFSNQPVPEQSLQTGKPAAAPRNFPFNVVARSNEPAPRAAGQKATVNPSPKPMLVSPLKIEKKGFDTNKLPPLAKPSAPSRGFIPAAQAPTAQNAAAVLDVEESVLENEAAEIEVEADEIDDLAPVSMRFSAGLFDVIIGVFVSLILLSPFILSGGSWLSISGFFAIAAAVAIVTFLYLTIAVAFVGRTFGMRLFSLELVDVEENAYPTLHQAAVNSAVFLLSLTFAGIGFIPMFFNEERRAAHDILSGTILIREY